MIRVLNQSIESQYLHYIVNLFNDSTLIIFIFLHIDLGYSFILCVLAVFFFFFASYDSPDRFFFGLMPMTNRNDLFFPKTIISIYFFFTSQIGKYVLLFSFLTRLFSFIHSLSSFILLADFVASAKKKRNARDKEAFC